MSLIYKVHSMYYPRYHISRFSLISTHIVMCSRPVLLSSEIHSPSRTNAGHIDLLSKVTRILHVCRPALRRQFSDALRVYASTQPSTSDDLQLSRRQQLGDILQTHHLCQLSVSIAQSYVSVN